MNEKYRINRDQWGYSVTQDGVGDIAFFKSSAAGSMAKENAQRLLLKLNRLDALEEVCWEIEEIAQADCEKAKFCTAYSDGWSAGVLSARKEIYQKLKAVLEEK